MKKIIALICTFLILSLSLITVFAVPSPTSAAKVDGLTIIVGDEEYVIPEDLLDGYLKIVHVHDAKEGSDLYNVGKDLATDDKLEKEFGEEWKDHTLIQLFTFERGGKLSGDKVEIGDFIENENGTFTIENAELVDVDDAKFIVRINMPSVKEGDNVTVMIKKGEWAQAEHVRVFNGYLTIEVSSVEDIDAIYATLAEKSPLSPPTLVNSNIAFLTVAFFAFAAIFVWSVKKYRFEK